ncbi:MAG: hypothetical protein DMF95_12525 [Acidobacteria bacterium]|nr:MAG: hypothetical protein DMF95_12525 [Acidobacteriota bacterium]
METPFRADGTDSGVRIASVGSVIRGVRRDWGLGTGGWALGTGDWGLGTAKIELIAAKTNR